MKSISFSDFKKNTANYFLQVEQGESFTILKHGKPIAEVIPLLMTENPTPSWKKPGLRLKIQGESLSNAIMDERESY
jgi:prevent-host-death family protein